MGKIDSVTATSPPSSAAAPPKTFVADGLTPLRDQSKRPHAHQCTLGMPRTARSNHDTPIMPPLG